MPLTFQQLAFDIFADYGTEFPLNRMNNKDRMALASAYLAENREELEALLARPMAELAKDFCREQGHG